MVTRLLTGDDDCDDILGWLDVHSVSLTQGLPAHLLHSKWQQAGRHPGRLGACLQLLFEKDWIALTPDVDPPHLRYTAEGFRRLLLAPLRPPREEAGAPTDIAPPPVAPTAVETAVVADLRYVRNGEPLTELGLRNEILSVYRDLRLRAGNRLIGVTLSRYWQEMGLRAGDLRTGLDVLGRDGYLKQRIDGMDRYWVLTDTGDAFIKAAATPLTLLRLSPPIDTVRPAPPPDELRRLAVHAFSNRKAGVGDALRYPELATQWSSTQLDTNALLHGLELLFKAGELEIDSGEPTHFALTAAGADFARRESAVIARLLSKLSRVIG